MPLKNSKIRPACVECGHIGPLYARGEVCRLCYDGRRSDARIETVEHIAHLANLVNDGLDPVGPDGRPLPDVVDDHEADFVAELEAVCHRYGYAPAGGWDR